MKTYENLVMPKKGDHMHIIYLVYDKSNDNQYSFHQKADVPKSWKGQVTRVTKDSFTILDMERVDWLEVRCVFGHWKAIDNYYKEPTLIRNFTAEARRAVEGIEADET